jgi:hypothetical protein
VFLMRMLLSAVGFIHYPIMQVVRLLQQHPSLSSCTRGLDSLCINTNSITITKICIQRDEIHVQFMFMIRLKGLASL